MSAVQPWTEGFGQGVGVVADVIEIGSAVVVAVGWWLRHQRRDRDLDG